VPAAVQLGEEGGLLGLRPALDDYAPRLGDVVYGGVAATATGGRVVAAEAVGEAADAVDVPPGAVVVAVKPGEDLR
jgi:hypothetical protein